jgi:hypothetical protein
LLDTDNEAAAKVAYRTVDVQHRRLVRPVGARRCRVAGSLRPQSPTKAAHDFLPPTPALLHRLADVHYLSVYESDFQWRGDLLMKVHEEAFWRGEIVKLPDDVCFANARAFDPHQAAVFPRRV